MCKRFYEQTECLTKMEDIPSAVNRKLEVGSRKIEVESRELRDRCRTSDFKLRASN